MLCKYFNSYHEISLFITYNEKKIKLYSKIILNFNHTLRLLLLFSIKNSSVFQSIKNIVIIVLQF